MGIKHECILFVSGFETTLLDTANPPILPYEYYFKHKEDISKNDHYRSFRRKLMGMLPKNEKQAYSNF